MAVLLLSRLPAQGGRKRLRSEGHCLREPAYVADRGWPYREQRKIGQLEDVGGLRETRKIGVPGRGVPGSGSGARFGSALCGDAGHGLRRLARSVPRNDEKADSRTLEHVLGVG